MIRVERYSASQLPADLLVRLSRFSLYTSVEFARVWATMGGREVFWTALRDGAIAAVLLGVEFHRRPFTAFQCMPNGLFARPWFAEDESDGREILSRTLLEAVSRRGYVKIFLNDFYRELTAVRSYDISEQSTTVIDLSDPDWRPSNRKTRAEVRKADREGTDLVDFDASRHFDRFLELVRVSKERHGQSTRYSESFFRQLASLAAIDNRIRWVVAMREEQPIASHIFFVDDVEALWWQLYFDRGFSYAKPNPFTFYTMAQRLALDGVKRINLGMSPPGASGIIAHKEKWGGESYRYPCYWRKSLIGRLR
jgi:hypothetical protein